jgi:hypothetical protein
MRLNSMPEISSHVPMHAGCSPSSLRNPEAEKNLPLRAWSRIPIFLRIFAGAFSALSFPEPVGPSSMRYSVSAALVGENQLFAATADIVEVAAATASGQFGHRLVDMIQVAISRISPSPSRQSQQGLVASWSSGCLATTSSLSRQRTCSAPPGDQALVSVKCSMIRCSRYLSVCIRGTRSRRFSTNTPVGIDTGTLAVSDSRL